MRIKEIVLASSLICVPLFGQNCASTPSTGTPLNLALPVVNCTQWNVQLNTNFSTINSFAATVALLSPTTSQMFTQPASTFTGFNAFSGRWESFCHRIWSGIGIKLRFLEQQRFRNIQPGYHCNWKWFGNVDHWRISAQRGCSFEPYPSGKWKYICR